MALNFPSSPNTGDVHNAANGLKYTYDGVKWTSQGAYSTGAIAPQKLDSIASSFNGTLKTFNLTSGGTTVNAHSAESVLISVAGVVKEPTTDYTVNVEAGTITFTSAPTNGQSFWGVVYSRLPIDLQTNLAKTGGTMTGVITFDSSQTFDASKLSGTVATASIADDAVTEAKLNADVFVTSGTSTSDTKTYSAKRAGEIFYGKGTVEEIQSGETWSASDEKVATTSAIDARITDLVDDVGGFVPIANETSFPAANPDVNNGAGTLVSVKEFASSHTPSSGTVTIANGAGSGNTVTITGCGSTVLSAGFGGIVETTTTLHTYTFHRLTPKATEVTTVAGNITNINTVAGNNANITTVAGNNANITTVAGSITNVNNVGGSISSVNSCASNLASVANYGDQYQVASSAPGTDGGGNALAEGDLYFDTSADELKVYNGSAWQGGVTDTANLVAKAGDTMTGNLVMDNQTDIRFEEATANGSNYIALQAPASIASNVTLTLPATDGSAGQHLKTDGSGALGWATDSTTDSSKMPLAGGTFTGIVNYANGKAVRFYELTGNGSNYVGLKAAAALSADTTYTLPTADGNADEFLKTNGSGALSWGLSSSGATGGSTDAIFVENERTVTTSYSITATKNAHSVGPIAINNNIVVTIPANSTWLVH